MTPFNHLFVICLRFKNPIKVVFSERNIFYSERNLEISFKTTENSVILSGIPSVSSKQLKTYEYFTKDDGVSGSLVESAGEFVCANTKVSFVLAKFVEVVEVDVNDAEVVEEVDGTDKVSLKVQSGGNTLDGVIMREYKFSWLC